MIKLIIVDDEASVRRALRMDLELESDLQVVGEAEDGAAAVRLVEALKPNVVLMDLRMPHMDGLRATRALKERGLRARVVILTIYDDPKTRSSALEAGAEALVGKHEPCEVLLGALRHAAGLQNP